MAARVYSQHAQAAASLLGKRIALGRKARRMTASDFAERVGVSRTTLHKIEHGDLKCEIGTVLEAAVLAGVVLFDAHLSATTEAVNDKLALLPKSVRKRRTPVDDDF